MYDSMKTQNFTMKSAYVLSIKAIYSIDGAGMHIALTEPFSLMQKGK